MATITGATATPSTVAKGGGTTKIVPTITNLDVIATVTLTCDTAAAAGTPVKLDIHEALTFTTDATKIGTPGYVVATVDQGGTLAVGADGASFVFTAS